ncbi:zinc fingers and homeoboxes protein 3 isoform 2-T2 [Discoglossus pictus]
MASKRKSSIPCMIPFKTMIPERGVDTAEEFKEKSPKEEPPDLLAAGNLNNNNDILTNGHQNLTGERLFCKYCNFGCHNTSTFVEHMDTKHLDFKNDPSYVCIACSFLVKDPKELESHNAESHAGDSGLTWGVSRHESYTVVEQSVCSTNYEVEDGFSEIPVAKTPIMRTARSRPEKKFGTIKDTAKHTAEQKKTHLGLNNGSVTVSRAVSNRMNSSVVNGSVIGTVPLLQTGMTQLVSINPPQTVIQPKVSVTTKHPVVQKSQYLHQNRSLPTAKSLPKVMIPLSSIPTYNATMDSDSFLKNSFIKFPYPTKAELCYLTVVTKYPEEQIKIWFTAQRLKQGISWSPEEIEDSRKKMFNTVIQSMPQPTITVLNAPLVANASNVQQLLQAALPGQIVGQPQGASGLLVTQPIITNGIPAASTSVALTVTSIPTNQTTHAKIASPAGKVVNASPPVTTTSPIASPTTPSESVFDNSFGRSKKSRHQLNALKNSFHKSQFPTQTEVTKLTKITGLSVREVRKWFSDKRYHWRTKGGYMAENRENLDAQTDVVYTMLKEEENTYAVPSIGHTPRRQSWNQTPDFTPTKYKERAPEQIKALESSFFQNQFPSEEEVNRLRSETKMTRREIDSWFSEKRKKLGEDSKKDIVIEEEKVDDESGDDLKEVVNEPPPAAENTSPTSTERKVNPIKINLKDLRVTESNDSSETPEDNNTVVTEGDNSRPPSPPKNRPYWKKSAQQREILKQTFVQTQWPTNQEYDDLVERTGLARADVVRWFGDCRYAYKNNHLKWFDRYKKAVGDIKSRSLQPLIVYHKQHHTLQDTDIEDLCEKAGMTADEVKAWFAEKAEEEKRVLSNTASEEVQSDGGEKSEIMSEATFGSPAVSENSESGETGTQETCADSKPSSNQSDTLLETD